MLSTKSVPICVEAGNPVKYNIMKQKFSHGIFEEGAIPLYKFYGSSIIYLPTDLPTLNYYIEYCRTNP